MVRFFSFFAALLLPLPLPADTTSVSSPARTIIRSIALNGNDALTQRELLDVMILKPTSSFSSAQLQQDLERIAAEYHEHGYFFARVRLDTLVFTSDSSFVDLVLSITEQQQARVGMLHVDGNTAFATEDILRQFDTKPDNVFHPSILERDIENLLRRYERTGYPFAQVRISTIRFGEEDAVEAMTNRHGTPEGALTITLHVDEGVFVQINEILVEGNKETETNVIVRETRLRPGEPYNEDKVRTIPQRLRRLNIFSSVNEAELYVGSRGGGLLIKVQEGPTNTFDGVAGYVPGISGEQGFFTGLVNVGMRNLFGTARKLNVRWQREDRLSQELALRYVEPWVLDFPVNLSGSFFQRQQDTTYVRRMIELKGDFMLTEHLTLGALYSHENVIPSSGVRFPSNSSTITTGVEVQYDSRDDIFSPTSGILYRSDYRIGRKKIFGLPDTSTLERTITVQKLGLDFEWFVETFPRQVTMLGLRGRELRSGNIEIGDLYRFGGANTMRGYRENQFAGSRVVWSNAEYRLLLARRSFVFGFFDSGYYFRPTDESLGMTSAQGFKYGYGVGIRLETALGNIGVSFALGEGDSFSQGKIHLGLINEF
jgi:outer membrane protein assembly factor BamA